MDNKIKYKLFRGPLEPVTSQRKAEVILHPRYLELICDYDFEPYGSNKDGFPYRRYAALIPKESFAAELTEGCHEDDIEKQMNPLIYIYYGGRIESIYVETYDEAYDIYKKIKDWMLNA